MTTVLALSNQQVRSEKPAVIGLSEAPPKREETICLGSMAEETNLKSNVLHFLR